MTKFMTGAASAAVATFLTSLSAAAAASPAGKWGCSAVLGMGGTANFTMDLMAPSSQFMMDAVLELTAQPQPMKMTFLANGGWTSTAETITLTFDTIDIQSMSSGGQTIEQITGSKEVAEAAYNDMEQGFLVIRQRRTPRSKSFPWRQTPLSLTIRVTSIRVHALNKG